MAYFILLVHFIQKMMKQKLDKVGLNFKDKNQSFK